MIPTLDYIKSKFDEFNALCFEGKLQPLPFKLSNARTFLGQVTFFQEKNPDDTWHYYGFTFRINTKIDLPEDVIEDTILHEMIHYWILSNQMQDTSAHGDLFMDKMHEINKKFNRNLTVAHKTTKKEQDSDKEIRQHLICYTRLRNGSCGVTIATRTSLFRLWDEMSRISDIAEQKWLISTDPFFNRIPRAVTPKVYIVPSSELEEHLQGAQELERRGNNIMVKK